MPAPANGDPYADIALDPQTRMRDAFAQLLTRNLQAKALPVEALWAGQGQQQLPQQQSPVTNFGGADISGELNTPMPQASPDPNLALPVAPQGPGTTEYRPAPQNKPFPGAKSVETKPYELPTQKDKKPSKKKGKG